MTEVPCLFEVNLAFVYTVDVFKVSLDWTSPKRPPVLWCASHQPCSDWEASLGTLIGIHYLVMHNNYNITSWRGIRETLKPGDGVIIPIIAVDITLFIQLDPQLVKGKSCIAQCYKISFKNQPGLPIRKCRNSVLLYLPPPPNGLDGQIMNKMVQW